MSGDPAARTSMTLMKSGHHPLRLAVAGFESVGWGQGDGAFGQHVGQAGEDVGEIFLGVDAEAAAVFDDGVEDGAFFAGFLVAEEQPVFGSELGGADGVFDEVVANFYPPIAKIGFEVGPLVNGVADGSAEFALGEDGTAEGEFVGDSLESLVNDAQEGEEFGISRYISLGGLGWLEESGHACGAATVMPVIEDGGAGDVRRPEVAGFGFAAAG